MLIALVAIAFILISKVEINQNQIIKDINK